MIDKRFTYDRYLQWDGKTFQISAYENENYIYVPIPKCGSTTMNKRLNLKSPFYPRIDIMDLKNKNKFKFTFVRNPYARLLSCWNGKIKNRLGSQITKMEGFNYDMSFNEFVRKVYLTPDYLCDQHFAPITTIVEDLSFDFIGKLENFEEDYVKLQKKINLPNATQKLAMTNVGKKYESYFTTELYELVNEKYDKDFKKFNYKKILK